MQDCESWGKMPSEGKPYTRKREESGKVKATFFFHKLIPKNTQMTTLYTN